VPDADLLARVRKLEGVVRELRSQPGAAGDSNAGGNNAGESSAAMLNMHPFNRAEWPESRPHDIEKEFGRLVVEEGKSRYGSSSLWTCLNEQVSLPP
jgi:hypothetical protein